MTASENMKNFDKWGPQEIEYAIDTKAKMPSMRTLGMVWDILQDIFSYSSYTPDEHGNWTKLLVVSQAAKVFDPKGYAIPVMLGTKLRPLPQTREY